MAEEPKRDDHQTDTAPADAPQDAQTDASQTQDDLPEEYKGKTQAELVKILQDKESFINQRNEELGQVRAEKSELENQAAFNQRFGGGQPQSNQSQDPYRQPAPSGGETPLQEEPRSDDDFLTYGDLKKMNQQMQKRDFEARTQLQMAEPFLVQAKKEAPHLFKGLNDQEVKGVVQSYLSSGQLHPMNLSNTKTWKMAATYTQGEKTNYNFIPTPTVTNPDQPVETGIPSQNKPIVSEEEKIPISDDDRKFAREVLGKADITDDDIREFIKKGAESQKTGVT
jgi:hypothetical protein